MSLTILTASRAWTAMGWTDGAFRLGGCGLWVGRRGGAALSKVRESRNRGMVTVLACLLTLAASPIVIVNAVREQPSLADVLAPAVVKTASPRTTS